MRIRKFTVATIRVPLKRLFQHATASRQDSENIVVCCHLENGVMGWGEGVPRTYVTGDSPESSMRLMSELPLKKFFDVSPAEYAEVLPMCERLLDYPVGDDPRGALGNPLKAAIELSVFDAYGQLFDQPMNRIAAIVPGVTSLLKDVPAVRYSTTIDAKPIDKLWFTALKMRAYGFRHCKVKVGSDEQADVRRLEIIRSWLGPKFVLRLDANGVWPTNESVGKIDALKRFNISCIEQPSPHEELPRLAEAKAKHGVRIMLDESLTSWQDALSAIRYAACDLFNLRLSKCGGFIACLRLAVLAKKNKLSYQLGCHPGETGILSAAGRQWAQAVQGYEFLEGSYDRHILRVNVLDRDITFGYGGVAKALTGSGLGVRVDLKKIEPLIISRQVHDLY